MVKKLSVLFIILIVAAGAVFAQPAREKAGLELDINSLEANTVVRKAGNLIVSSNASVFKDAGFEVADVVKVSFLDQELELPVVPDYSYVDAGATAVIFKETDSDFPDGFVALAINMGDFTTTYRIGTKTVNDDKSWYWTAEPGIEFPIRFTFSMSEKQGYSDQYLLHQLVRTNNRSDYPDLTDEQFANFRRVDTTGMHGKLYRSSEPVDDEIGRAKYADEACRKAGITIALNFSADQATEEAYEGFAGSYYSTIKVKYLNLNLDFLSAEFGKGLAEGLKFMADNPGIYLIHCVEGKDRTGFSCAILECLMGASAQEVLDDYMLTYTNYYGVEKGTPKYDTIAKNNIEKTLKAAFGVDDLFSVDLAACAEKYLLSIGMTADEIQRLKANL